MEHISLKLATTDYTQVAPIYHSHPSHRMLHYITAAVDSTIAQYQNAVKNITDEKGATKVRKRN
jgi:hypothetical protein